MDRRRFLRYAGFGAASIVTGYCLRDVTDHYASIPSILTSTTQTVTETTTQPLICSASLRAAAEARGLLLGSAVFPQCLNRESYPSTLAREFNYLTPEEVMTWSSIHPGPDTWNFAPVDTLVDFASNHQMKVKGHTLIWSVDYFGLSVGQIGQMREMTTDDFRQTVNEHISTLLGHYKGKIHAWNVLCEALDESGELRKSLFLEKMGQGYVADIFHMAHEADPDAILLYHDYGAEGLSPKSDGQYKLVKYLVNEHVPIDGVALQMHLAATNEPPNIITMSKSNPRLTLKDISENIRRLADLGLKVEIAEMDLQIRNLQGDLPERLKLQRRIYHDVIDTCLREKGFTDITFWGFTDAYSWIDQTFGPDDPLLFDENYQPKPAYWGVMDALLSA